MGEPRGDSHLRIIPQIGDFGPVQSNAELRVAELLQQVDLGIPSTALYSLHLPKHEYKRMSEIDFLLVLEDMVLVVEVKGGRLSRRNGVWSFQDRYGEIHDKREGPFEQARTGMHAIEATLREKLPGAWPLLGYLVLTPDQQLDDDVEWSKEEYLGGNGMTVSGLERALDRSRQFWRAKSVNRAHADLYQDLLRVLRPDFDRIPSLSSRTNALEYEYVKLAERQYELLQAAEGNDRIVCTGGAGSGKSLLAVEAARRAEAKGQRVLLTCRSHRLADTLAERLRDTSVACMPLSRADGLPPFDVLIVDEAQDLMDTDSYVALDALMVGGWDRGRWRVFCDPNNQANIDGRLDLRVLRELQVAATSIDLPYNCRNTSTIVLQTQEMTGADLGVARAGQGPPVEYVKCATDADAAALLDAHLKRLRRDEIPLGEVAVVTLRAEPSLSSAVETRAYRSGLLARPDQSASTTPGGSATLLTVAEIKGLEAAHVCVVDVEELSDQAAIAHLYVAMTRARISLWVALGEDAWRQAADISRKESVPHV